MICGFMKKFPWGDPTNFQEKILKKIKRTTIRRGTRWKVGHRFQAVHGNRTKHMHQFAEGVVTNVNDIIIIPAIRQVWLVPDLIIDPNKAFDNLRYVLIESLAIADGFDTVDDFWRYFSIPKNLNVEGKFEGQLIRWELNENFVPNKGKKG